MKGVFIMKPIMSLVLCAMLSLLVAYELYLAIDLWRQKFPKWKCILTALLPIICIILFMVFCALA